MNLNGKEADGQCLSEGLDEVKSGRVSPDSRMRFQNLIADEERLRSALKHSESPGSEEDTRMEEKRTPRCNAYIILCRVRAGQSA